MNVGSLFSGIGGIELGFERAGFKTLWFVECDRYAQTILRKHWPETTIYGDIKKVDFTAIPKVDILTGGFPCQDISNAGKKAGITGSRSSLWKYYLKAIREIRPKFALIENVSALTIRGQYVVLADLAEIGYDAEWYNLSASAVGAPHRRERIFILAYPANYGCCIVRLPTEKGCKRESCEEIKRSGQNVADTSSWKLEGLWPSWKQELEAQCRERKFNGGCQDVADTEVYGRKRCKNKKYKIASLYVKEGLSSSGSFRKRSEGWIFEPDVGRVADGIPFRVDRIKCLGNAVVPQCAEIFAQAIKERMGVVSRETETA